MRVSQPQIGKIWGCVIFFCGGNAISTFRCLVVASLIWTHEMSVVPCPLLENTKLSIDIVTYALETKSSQMDTTDLAKMKRENTHPRIKENKNKNPYWYIDRGTYRKPPKNKKRMRKNTQTKNCEGEKNFQNTPSLVRFVFTTYFWVQDLPLSVVCLFSETQ